MSSFKCEVCGNEYSYRKILKRHISTAHPQKLSEMMPPVTDKEPSCTYQRYICDKDFTCKSSLKRHQQNIHGQPQQQGFKCTMCAFETDSKKCWIDHFQSAHGLCVKPEALEFSSEEEFLKWKEEMECATHSKFIKSCGTKFYDEGPTCYYVCHRSGQFTSKGDGRRHLKLTGSNKINGKCPAEIKVQYKEGKCHVTFVSTHVGHDLDLSHLNLTEKEQMKIAEDIAAGIPFPTVLQKIQETVQSSNLKRVHLTTMQDLHNIAAAYNLSSKSVRHSNDAISVEAWVQEVQQSDNPCVLFYKPQETINDLYPELKSEDFALIIMNNAQGEILTKYGGDCICVDGTHGLNGYDFEVTTLLVLDDMRQGFPCAFLISNRNDSDVLSIFFNCVKSQVGQISPKVFMTDLAESYSIAWNKTMGHPEMRFFCTWHVDRAWRANIKSKIRSSDKRNEVYKLVKSLMQVRDVAVFQESLVKALQKLNSDPETSEFFHYFKTYYEKNVKCWAYCHRMRSGLNTNMHLESMHKTLKYIHANAKQVKRLDKGISALMSLVTAKLFDRLIVNVKGKLTSKMKNIRRKHKCSILMNKDSIRKVGRGWEVPATKSHEVYLVQENNIFCNCKLVCTDCKVCIHRYSCTCIDYSIKLNMCKHIHNVCQLDSTEQNPFEISELQDAVATDVGDMSCINEKEVILKQVSGNANSCTPEALAEEKRKIISRFSEIVSGMSATEVQLANKMVTSLKVNVGAVRTSSGISFISPQRSLKRNLLPQRRLFSTKKTSSSKRISMAVPNAEETNNILRTLLDEDL
ncbi:uncharacterized protein LOC124788816 [Schistocerca piceifrons]|uniref:uncharacterized protein LOC124788816 n=1 Tax=Schistocerca piceifrons TaxID=274613 RepID=UPI001F5E8927|nr:uncharacterized protein LOC124788816 [Schistocerca piceifrons]